MGLETALLVFQAASAIKGFADQRSAAKDTKRANRAAAQQAEIEAQKVRDDAAFAEEREQRDAKRARSAQLAQYLASGVTIDGSPLLALDETTSEGNVNAQNIRTNANADAESILLNAEANRLPVQKADIFGTASTVLGAADQARKSTKKSNSTTTTKSGEVIYWN